MGTVVTTRSACSELGELQRTLDAAVADLRVHLDAGPLAGFDAARCARIVEGIAHAIADRARADANHVRSVS
jgi:hypothetical protein